MRGTINQIPFVEIPAETWEPVGHTYGAEDPRTCLLSTIILCGCWMHVEALEVRDVESMQYAADEALEEHFEKLQEGDPGYLETAEIQGRTYALFCSPHHD